ncbi:hypothetical protein CEXT_472521 [Caerostris extrusa]|uniref:Uncharacterized protein n=1 Tax=Caerostris extrusa TaxID=172846 RepID=A0AAV4VY28_CAEEX|nr:hypothetical protein CEXT_472521 [Caerostris extrusa]
MRQAAAKIVPHTEAFKKSLGVKFQSLLPNGRSNCWLDPNAHDAVRLEAVDSMGQRLGGNEPLTDNCFSSHSCSTVRNLCAECVKSKSLVL